MLSTERIRVAGELVEWLRQSIHEQPLPASYRVRAAAACYAIAQDHHHAIVLLIQNRLYASSFALVRLEFEAYVRGLWLATCAHESEINKFVSVKNWEPPSIGEQILKIEEKLGEFQEQTLSIIKKQSWKSMCAYTHTGGLHVQRWNTEDGIEPNYSPDEVEEVLRFSELIGAMSAIGIAELGNLTEIAEQIFAKIEEAF